MFSRLKPSVKEFHKFTEDSAKRVRRGERRTIAVAVDESKNAEVVFDYVVKNFNQEGDMVVFVHATPPSDRVTTSFVADASDARARMPFAEKWVEKARSLTGKETSATFDCVVLVGDPREELLVFVEALAADTLVIGSRGLSTIPRLLLGSVSTFCVHHCSCPVVVVKTKEVDSHRKEHDNQATPAAATAAAPDAATSAAGDSAGADAATAAAEVEVHGEVEAENVLLAKDAAAGNILNLDSERKQEEEEDEDDLTSPLQQEVSKIFKEEITLIDQDNEDWADKVKEKAGEEAAMGVVGNEGMPEAQPAALAA